MRLTLVLAVFAAFALFAVTFASENAEEGPIVAPETEGESGGNTNSTKSGGGKGGKKEKKPYCWKKPEKKVKGAEKTEEEKQKIEEWKQKKTKMIGCFRVCRMDAWGQIKEDNSVDIEKINQQIDEKAIPEKVDELKEKVASCKEHEKNPQQFAECSETAYRNATCRFGFGKRRGQLKNWEGKWKNKKGSKSKKTE